ncbi:MAG TPA: OB-fold domain-containing protein [Dehalococcoidia bacterium]|nr:OB-fold domain-containing protein [Dehalococcoidia bacterium]
MSELSQAQRPLPEVSPLTEPFWAGARDRVLLLQRCSRCHRFRFPPEHGCGYCGSPEFTWERASGRATLYSWTVAHAPHLPFFMERLPWPVAVVQLEEGPRMVTNLVGVPVERYQFGMPLQVDFLEVDAEITLPVFRPAEG